MSEAPSRPFWQHGNDPPPDLGDRTVRGGAIAVVAKVLRIALQLGVMAILARLLGPEDFGLVAMATVATGLVGLFSDFGLSVATVQRRTVDQDTLSALFFVNLGLGVAAAAAVVALAPAAAWFFDDPRVLEIVVALALPIPLIAAGYQHTALLQRGMRWLTLEWIALAAQAGAAVAAILVAWGTELGYWALVVQAWVSAALTLVLTWGAFPWRPSLVRDWQGARQALRFGANLFGFGVVNYLQRQMDDVLIGWRWGAADLGYYSRAYVLLTLPLQLINTPVGHVMIPALSRLQDQPERWRRALLDAMAVVALITSGIVAVLIAAAEPMVALVYGPGWSETARIFTVLALAMFPATVMNATGWIYISLGRTRRMFVWGLLCSALMLGAFLVGLPFGALGVATAHTVTMFLVFGPGIAFALHGTSVRMRQVIRAIGPSMVAGATAAGAGLLLAGHLGQGPALYCTLSISAVTLAVYSTAAIPIALFSRDLAAFRERVMALLPSSFFRP